MYGIKRSSCILIPTACPIFVKNDQAFWNCNRISTFSSHQQNKVNIGYDLSPHREAVAHHYSRWWQDIKCNFGRRVGGIGLRFRAVEEFG